MPRSVPSWLEKHDNKFLLIHVANMITTNGATVLWDQMTRGVKTVAVLVAYSFKFGITEHVSSLIKIHAATLSDNGWIILLHHVSLWNPTFHCSLLYHHSQNSPLPTFTEKSLILLNTLSCISTQVAHCKVFPYTCCKNNNRHPHIWLIMGPIVTFVSTWLPTYLQVNTGTESKDSRTTDRPRAACFYGWQLMVTPW